MKQAIIFPNGREVTNLGQGTWKMAEDYSKRQAEIEALRTGIELGATVLDTAEMYGEGAAEELLGEAIQPYNREDLFLISKVYPYNAGEQNIFHSCEQTLERLGVDELDLYLLHWRGSVPLQETVDCFEELKRQGKIKAWGVSNFDLEDMQELLELEDGQNCQTNQVLYNLASRGIEVVLNDYLKAQGIPVMAYCPIIGQNERDRQRVFASKTVKQIAEKHGLIDHQLLLAFVTQQEQMIAIPKAGSKEHVIQNNDVLSIKLTINEMNLLNEAFPVPTKRVPLDIE